VTHTHWWHTYTSDTHTQINLAPRRVRRSWDLGSEQKNWGKYADSPSKTIQGIKVASATLVIFDSFFCYICVSYDLFMGMTCEVTPIHAHDSCVCVTWPIYVCDIYTCIDMYNIYMYAYTYINRYTSICQYVHLFVNICVHIYIFIYIYIYMYIWIYIYIVHM